MGHVPWLGTYHAVPLNCAAPWLCEPPSDHLAARHRAPLGAIFCSRKHEKRWKLRRDLEYLRTFRQSQPFQVFIHINYYYYDYYYYIYIQSVAPHGFLQFCQKFGITSVKVRWDAGSMTTLTVGFGRCENPVKELRVLNALDVLILKHVLKSTDSRPSFFSLQILKSETSEEQNLNHSLAEF